MNERFAIETAGDGADVSVKFFGSSIYLKSGDVTAVIRIGDDGYPGVVSGNTQGEVRVSLPERNRAAGVLWKTLNENDKTQRIVLADRARISIGGKEFVFKEKAPFHTVVTPEFGLKSYLLKFNGNDIKFDTNLMGVDISATGEVMPEVS